MRLLVVGAGSTGGYFGGRLVQAGQSVYRSGRSALPHRLLPEHHRASGVDGG